MSPTAKGQRPESIDISANVNSADALLIHTLFLSDVLRVYRDGRRASNFKGGVDQENTPSSHMKTPSLENTKNDYSHSIVPGGFDVTSYTTRLTPRTWFVILFETSRKN